MSGSVVASMASLTMARATPAEDAEAVHPSSTPGVENPEPQGAGSLRWQRARLVLDQHQRGESVASSGRVLPVRAELAELLPQRGLRRGSTVVVRGSTSVLLALLATATADGSWAAVVGMPDLGLLAAAEMGVAIPRLALVPQPGAEFGAVVAALLDGVGLVAVDTEGSMAGRRSTGMWGGFSRDGAGSSRGAAGVSVSRGMASRDGESSVGAGGAAVTGGRSAPGSRRRDGDGGVGIGVGVGVGGERFGGYAGRSGSDRRAVRPEIAALARRLSARARHHDSVLISVGAWPGADLELDCTEASWSGLGTGHGQLAEREVTITVRGRGVAARPTKGRVLLPAALDRLRQEGTRTDALPAHLREDGPADPAASQVVDGNAGWATGRSLDRNLGLAGGRDVDRVADLATGQVVDGNAGWATGRSLDRNLGLAGGRDAGRVADLAAGQVVDGNAGWAADRSLDRSLGLAGDRNLGRLSDRDADRLADLAASQAADGDAGRSLDRSLGLAGDRDLDRLSNRSADRVAGWAAARATGRSADRDLALLSDRSAERVADRAIDRPAKRSAERVADRSAERVVGRGVDRATGRNGGRAVDLQADFQEVEVG